MGGWSSRQRVAHQPSKQNYVDAGSKGFHKFLLTVRVPHCMSLGSRSTWRAWVSIHLKTISYRGSVIGGSTTAAAGVGFEIQSIFRSGSSAARFIMSVNEVTTSKSSPPLFEELGGVWGGGTILACMPTLHSLKNRLIEAPMNIFADKKALGRILDRLDQIDESISGLERKYRSSELEYIELYDKVKRQMSRMAKRYAVDLKDNAELPELPDPDDGLDPISRSILARRGQTRTKL